MSKQRRVKTAVEVQAQRPVVLFNVILDSADSELPKTRETVRKKQPVNRAETLRLKRTRDAGGLVDDHTIAGTPARARIIPVAKAKK